MRCDSAAHQAIRRYGLRLPKALAELDGSQATTNLSRRATYDQILHPAANPGRFTDDAGVVDSCRGDHKPLYPEIATVREFTFQLRDRLPL